MMKKIYRKILAKKRSIFDYHRHVIAKGDAYIGKKCEFEGRNVISNGASVDSIKMGYGSYVGTNSNIHHTTIGRFSCIGSNVRIIVGNHPTSQFVSIHPAFYSIRKQAGFTYVAEQLFNEISFANSNGDYVEIGNDVWIGSEARLIGGISIGDGAIIAAGAMVSRDVPPYAIVGGVPAKLLRYRFDESQIAKLLKIKWWEKDEKWINENSFLFSNISTFLNNEEVLNGENEDVVIY